ncbi:RNA-dependent RNA polymerase [Tulasnella partitivirus 3]|nr:RNA-dependent RNA polymerase [Tulasnella partitivirus 3]
MDYLTHAFSRITSWFKKPTNLEYVGVYEHDPPRTAYTNLTALDNHQATIMHSMRNFFTDEEIHRITHDYRRSEITMEAILADFFANDVEQHDIPWDQNTENGLACMAEAFRPPRPCLPAHIQDVEHHYPYKWQVNSEPPFSTDAYFKENLPTFGEFIDSHGYDHIDKEDFLRRHQDLDNPSFRNQVTPPKFGFQKTQIFNWTRRWHHIIKDGFTNTTGLINDYYLQHRYIFPMLLHTKTAIVKKDDPNKMRTIWGCSKPWIIADTMFYWEYIAWAKLNRGATPLLWGYETFTGGWFRLNAELFNGYMKASLITLDWSRFDKRAYFSLILRIMYIARTFLDFNRGYLPNVSYPEHKNWNADKATRLQRLWEWTLENLFKAAIVLPNGDMYQRRFAGIPSGLFITQLLDSWYNYTMLATLLSALGLDPRTCIIKVQGDDSIIRLAVLIPPNEHTHFLTRLTELAEYYFKAVIAAKKSEMSNQLNNREVLSYRHINGIPYRDEFKMLAQFYHTKARDPTPSITMAQCIGFAYASCGNHSRVLQFLEDVYLYYAKQGYTPNRAGLTAIFGNSPDMIDFPFALDHFPTKKEIRQYFVSTDYKNEISNAKTWPMTYFTYPPCHLF